MRTLILSNRPPQGVGGRPMKVGSFAFDEESGVGGILVGYSLDGEPIKIIARRRYFEQIAPQLIGREYKVTIEFGEVKRLQIFDRIISRLIPDRFKVVDNSIA